MISVLSNPIFSLIVFISNINNSSKELLYDIQYKNKKLMRLLVT